MSDLTPKPERRLTFKRALLTGFITLFPLILTYFVLATAWGLVRDASTPMGNQINNIENRISGGAWTPEGKPAKPLLTDNQAVCVTVSLSVLVMIIVGYLTLAFFGRKVTQWLDSFFTRLPVLGSIYPHARSLSNLFFGEKTLQPKSVVAIQYPCKGIYTLGFVTGVEIAEIAHLVGKKLVTVFIPTSPTPFTGWTILLPEEDVIYLHMPMNDAVRYIVSCGVVAPGAPAHAQIAENADIKNA